MEAVDLSHVPVVDNHYHGVSMDQAFADVAAWCRQFTESTDPGMGRDHASTTAFYRRLIRTLAHFLDCDPTEAPSSKLMYSSDGIGVPESHWMSATDGRRVIGEALGEMVAYGELGLTEAEAAGEGVLRGNATRLYGLCRTAGPTGARP